MSDIIIEGKNLKDIDQSNFQSVGPYTNPNETQVKEPWQGRYKLSGSEDTDLRFDLGTYTDNNRGFWESQTTDPNTRLSQFESKDLKTARAKILNGLVLSDEVKWSVDTFPYVVNSDNDETVPLYFYYDDELHPSEYNAAVNGKINLKIELREDGRNQNGIIDNFLERESIRPFVLGLNINQYGTEANGELLGAGAFLVGDRVVIEANPNSLSYFEQWSGGKSSTSNPYYFDMPREDIEVIGNFRPNPIINIVPRGDGSTTLHESAAELWVGTQDELTNSYLDIGAGLGISIINDDYFYFETEFERQTLRPGTDLIILHNKLGNEYEFENYSYIGNDGEEVILEDEDPTYSYLDKVGRIGKHTMLSQPEYPEGILQIYANFAILLAYIRSFNDWIATQSAGQSISHRLIWGYGGGSSYDDWTQIVLDSTLGIRLNVDENGGYTNGDYFWYQVDSAESAQPSSNIWLTAQPFDEALLRTLNDPDDDYYNDGVTLTIPRDNLALSDLGTQITGTRDAYHYIGRRFIQEGVYIKITQADGSANFNIDDEPDPVNIIREKLFSPEIDADMYQIAPDLELTWVIGHHPGQSELPTVQNIEYWDDDIKDFVTTNNLSEIGMTFDQEGGNQSETVEPNQVVLNYPTPSSNESDNYYKYINIRLFSEAILQPFLGVFEIDFHSNSENLGTVSFLEQAPEIPQTTIIGLFGNANSIDTPTHAIDMNTWHDGDTSGVIPIPLDIDINDVDTELGTLTTTLAPNFSNRVDQILDNSNFDNYDASFKEAIKNSLINNYLNFQITDSNSFSIEPGNDETQPNNPPAGFSPSTGDFMEDTLSPAGQWIWTGTNWVSYLELDSVREVLEFIEQNNNVPRLPLRITGFFVQMFTLTLSPTLVYNLNDGNSYPTKFITNWDQAAYNENSSLSAADTWINDDLLEVDFDDMLEETLQISIPPIFFNGQREFKIITAISPNSDAVGGSELSFSGTSDPVLYTTMLTTYSHRHRIVNMDSSANINLSYVGAEDTGGV